MEPVENFLDTMSSHGINDDQVVGICRAFTSFLLGNLLLDVAQRGV